jgi:hypothetical protein
MAHVLKARLALVSVVLATLGVLVLGGTTGLASGGKLRCFADAPATCTLTSTTTATIDASQGGDAGVFFSNGKSTNGFPLANVGFTFTYSCHGSADVTSCISGGVPRWSIPISTDGTSTTAGYAFIDAANCLSGGTQPSGGALTVGTTVSTCPVFFGPNEYANWDAFAAANPTYTISGAIPFVIADFVSGGAIDVSSVVVTKS